MEPPSQGLPNALPGSRVPQMNLALPLIALFPGEGCENAAVLRKGQVREPMSRRRRLPPQLAATRYRHHSNDGPAMACQRNGVSTREKCDLAVRIGALPDRFAALRLPNTKSTAVVVE